MKKFLTTLTLSIFIIGGLVPTAHAQTADIAFDDIFGNEHYYDAINYAYTNNIVGGFSDNTFKPLIEITRGEFTKVIINTKYNEATVKECDIAENSFPDVDETNQFAGFLCIAKRDLIISGYSDGMFRLDENITFGQASKIISNAYNYTTGNVETSNEDIFSPYLIELDSRNAIPSTISVASEALQRSEMVEIIYRLDLEIQDKPSSAYYDMYINDPVLQTLRDSRRQFYTVDTLNALTSWVIDGNSLVDLVDNSGNPIKLCSEGYTEIQVPGNDNFGDNLINLESILVPQHIDQIHTDPAYTGGPVSGFSICNAGNNRVTIEAQWAETIEISATR